MRKTYIILFSLFAALLLCSFAKNKIKSQEQLMQEYIDEKLQEARTIALKKCRENTIKDAVEFVDSIIINQNNFDFGDSIDLPAKPIKPVRPFDTLKLDSTIISPILEKN